MAGRWHEGGLTRHEVAARVAAGWSWRLTFCEGSFQTPIDGVGDLPGDVLARVPTATTKQKSSAGKSDKAYFHAREQIASDREVLLLEEG
jgi:hypothetical protein